VSTTDNVRRGEGDLRAYEQIQASEQFQRLRRKHRSIVFPMTVAFLAWYLLYVLLADYAHGFMSTRIASSNITVGLVFGLAQFASTFAITSWYRRRADRELDPLAEAIRRDYEQIAASGTPSQATDPEARLGDAR
jgi:uncharacterized membrane protein (DUF485 family)